jgi:hypothetical protein
VHRPIIHVSAAAKTLPRLAALFLGLLLLVPAPVSSAASPMTTTTPKATTPAKAKTTTTKSKAKTTTAKSKATAAAVGATGKKCWNDLIRDWYDGRIDKTYPVHCYQDALKHLPSDVRTYSDAYDVISRALAAATRGKKRVNPNSLVAPPAGGKTGTTTPNGTTTSASPGPIGGGLNSGDRGATGIPVPLLVLGGLAILLVAAGALGFLSRRFRGRGGGGPAPS